MRNTKTYCKFQRIIVNHLKGDVGDTVSLQAQTSPYFQLRENFKCIEHTDKSETQLKISLKTGPR